MGRAIEKRPVSIPQGVKVEIKEDKVLVKGKLGNLSVDILPDFSFELKKDGLWIKRNGPLANKAKLGLLRSLIENAIEGVSKGFSKKLEVRGIGYKVQLTGKKLELRLGYSHPIFFEVPEGIELEVEYPKTREDKEWIADIVIKGIDKQLVGQIAANLKKLRKPDVYKGKGIRYKGEYIRKKLGKRAVGGEA